MGAVALRSVWQWQVERGTLAHGWDQERGSTLVRIRALVIRLSGVEYTVQGVRRHGWAAQVPARRALERDDAGAGRWRSEVGRDGRATAAARDAFICFEDEAEQRAEAVEGHTWAPRGQTPVVRGSNRGRVSVADVVCHRSGERFRLVCRLHGNRGRKDEVKTVFTWRDYRDLIVVEHNQLKTSVVWVWGQSARPPGRRARRQRRFLFTTRSSQSPERAAASAKPRPACSHNAMPQSSSQRAAVSGSTR
ncbi:winged helix-turn-helix domain-containing protein [Streptomyces sp. NPDC051576]|uniref:winged helix-turn-helix domain-containing protein n=1 Tax=Streptomyces sp. NPDC051576 TaxID=3155803 RepID=UPI00343B9E1D